MKKFKLGLLTLMAFATLAACGNTGDDDPPVIDEPTEEMPGEESTTPGEGEEPELGDGDVYEEDVNEGESTPGGGDSSSEGETNDN